MANFRITTYNIHKCRGLDRRVRPRRIAAVLKETESDIIALQEVVGMDEGELERNQVRIIAEELEFEYRIGENRGKAVKLPYRKWKLGISSRRRRSLAGAGIRHAYTK